MQRFFVEQMAMYSAYHRDRRNKATHFLGVPSIAFSLLIPMAMLRFGEIGGVSITLATIFALAVMAYWIVLDAPFGIVTAVLFLPALWAADWLALQAGATAWVAFAVLFVGGWIVQLVGHAFEGRKPALVDNLLQIFIAPVFLVAEVAFAIGLRRDLFAAVEQRWPAYAKRVPSAETRAAH
jgi:uncharacterized membrane protein YGL010W